MTQAAAQTSQLSCRCGTSVIELTGPPIMATECMCNSCRNAGAILGVLPGAKPLVDSKGATLTAMYRKDRIACPQGADSLREYRLKPESKTRRVVASCCNTAMFLEFTSGHWIDIYGSLWPPSQAPVPEMRTMAGDLPDPTALPDDIPNAKGHSLKFFAKLIGAWIAMRLRTPKITFVKGTLDVASG